MDEQRQRIRDEALDWSIRLRGPGADNILRAELERWIARSDAHAKAWAKVEKTWGMMSAIPPVHQEQWANAPAGKAAVARHAPMRRHWRAASIAAVAACLLLFFASPMLWIWARADYSTGAGEIHQMTLADGSTVHLDTGSAVRIDYDGSRRGVTLLAGQAFFEVTPNKSRPFIVRADDVNVQVVGTAFDVQLAPTTISVAVQHGAVRVGKKGIEPLLLAPGDRIRIDRTDDGIERSNVPPARIAAWRSGQIVVNGATVAEVVEELRRYHRGFILIRDNKLAARRVTGAYDVRDPAAALRAIVQPYGGEISGIGGYLLIIS
ncbi:MAG: FecR domain-containing protein [Sphingobium sp.]